MTSDIIYKHGPSAREGDMSLYGRGTSPDGKQSLQAFTANIVWFRESETQIRLMHGGKVVDEIASYVDSGHFLSSLASALGQALGIARHFDVTKQSTLSVETVTTIVETPLLRKPKRPSAMFTEFRGVGNAWWLGEIEQDFEKRVRLQPIDVVAPQVLWSTTEDAAQTLVLFDHLVRTPGLCAHAMEHMASRRAHLASVLGVEVDPSTADMFDALDLATAAQAAEVAA